MREDYDAGAPATSGAHARGGGWGAAASHAHRSSARNVGQGIDMVGRDTKIHEASA